MTTIGRILYCIGIIAVGVQQAAFQLFRQEVLSPFPAWAHQSTLLPVFAGMVLIFAGISISGLFVIPSVSPRKVSLYLGFLFLVLAIVSHLPYTLFLNPDGFARLDAWFGMCQALAYSGGAFVMAGSFSGKSDLWLENLIPAGRIFFSILMIVFGASHFVFTDFVSTMVPRWAGFPLFWTYLCGAALMGAGIAIIFKIWIRPVAYLLATMLFIFFVSFHIPDAIANPTVSNGNEIVRAIIALVYCGIALVIAGTNDVKQ